MTKRKDRIRPIEHEMRQLENLKTLPPNMTPVKYKALSEALIDVAKAALDIVRALEARESADFDRLYDLVDGLEDAL